MKQKRITEIMGVSAEIIYALLIMALGLCITLACWLVFKV